MKVKKYKGVVVTEFPWRETDLMEEMTKNNKLMVDVYRRRGKSRVNKMLEKILDQRSTQEKNY